MGPGRDPMSPGMIFEAHHSTDRVHLDRAKAPPKQHQRETNRVAAMIKRLEGEAPYQSSAVSDTSNALTHICKKAV